MLSENNFFNIYIDEAGDEGFKFDIRPKHGSSEVFVLSAIVVSKKDDLRLAYIVNDLKKLFNYQEKDMLSPLHFVKMPHSKRKACVNALAKFKDFYIFSVILNKKAFFKINQLKNIKGYIYDYCCIELVETISSFLKKNDAKGNFIFEHRRATKYDALKHFLEQKTDFKKIESGFSVLSKSQSKCLQLADITASSIFQAFEPNEYGDIEESYLLTLYKNIFVFENQLQGLNLILFNKAYFKQDKYKNIYNLLQNICTTIEKN